MKTFIMMLCLGLLVACAGPKHVDTTPDPLLVKTGLTADAKPSRYYIYRGVQPHSYMVMISGTNKQKDALKATDCDHSVCIPVYWGEVYVIEKPGEKNDVDKR